MTWDETATFWPLEAVMELVGHRSAGTGGVDTLKDANKRRQLIRILLSIDGQLLWPRHFPAQRRGFVGVRLSSKIVSSPSAALPVTLDGSTLSFGDATGILRLARLFFGAPGQMNFESQPGMAAGLAIATLQAGSGIAATETVKLYLSRPG